MILLCVVAVTVAAAATAFRRPLGAGLITMLGVLLLVPDTLTLPWPGFGRLPVIRIVLLAFVAGLAVRARTGEVWRADLRPTRIHLAFVAYLVIVGLTGVVLSGDPKVGGPLTLYLHLVEQFVAFSAVLVALRARDDLVGIGRAAAGLLLASAAIALFEHLTGRSFAREILTAPGMRPTYFGAEGLVPRAGGLRVRAAAQFALAFGWISAIMFPLLASHALRAKRRLWRVTPVLVVLTIGWSASRSALPALVLGTAVLVVGSRFERPYVLFAIVAALAAVAGLAGTAKLTSVYNSTEAVHSDDTRVTRLAAVTEEAARHPVRGLGLGSLQTKLDYYGADASYLQAYVETGAAGLVGLVALLLTVVLTVAGALRGPPGPQRALGAACLAAVVLGVAGACFYDLFSVPGSDLTFWFLAALGVALAERASPAPAVAIPAWVPRASRLRVLLPVGGLVFGLALAAGAPRHAAVRYRFETITVARMASSTTDLEWPGLVLARTACARARSIEVPDGVRVGCRVIDIGGGIGVLRVQAPNARLAALDGDALTRRLADSQVGLRFARLEGPVTGRPSLASTAPVWGSLAGLLLALLLPPPRDPTRRPPWLDAEAVAAPVTV